MFGKKMRRVKFRTGWADVALDEFGNVGDVLEIPEATADVLVRNGVAEPTEDAVGRAPSLASGAVCWACGGRQHGSFGWCEYCRAPL
jgi:hypothetical protein